MSSGIRLSYEEVKAAFRAQGCELLETEYKNARTKMKYRCLCGEVAEIKYDNFRSGNRCRKCGNKKNSEKQRLSHEIVAEYFKSQNCELLSTYESNLKPMEYRCECGTVAFINWNNFYTKGRRCWECGIKRRSGENHYDWREDRDALNNELLFRQRCYKLIKMVFNVTGRVKNDRTEHLLGYKYTELQEHIQRHPNWKHVKHEPWHIDHIFPIKAFIDHGISDLKIINGLDNLRPLAAKDNLCKNAKYDKDEFIKWLASKGIKIDEN